MNPSHQGWNARDTYWYSRRIGVQPFLDEGSGNTFARPEILVKATVPRNHHAILVPTLERR